MKKLFTVLGLFALVYFITYWSLFAVDVLKMNQQSDYIKGVLGAFLGALFAFLFFIASKFLGNIYKNSIEHRNALVNLEYSLSRFMAINYDNIFLINALIKSIDTNILNSPNFTPLDIDESIMSKLKNIDMVNDVHNLYIDIYKQNHSLKTISDFYNEFREMLLKKEINLATFNTNIKGKFKDDLIEVIKRLQAMDKNFEIISSKCVVLLNEDEYAITWLIGLLAVKRSYPKNFDDLCKEELKILQKGRSENYRKSLDEIESLKVDNS